MDDLIRLGDEKEPAVMVGRSVDAVVFLVGNLLVHKNGRLGDPARVLTVDFFTILSVGSRPRLLLGRPAGAPPGIRQVIPLRVGRPVAIG